MGTGSNLAEQVVGIDRKRLFVIAGIAALLLSVLIAVSAYANHFTTAGEPELYNLEHVFNFDPAVLDGDTDLFPDGVTAGETKGSDVEFFTHSVPLRNYSTGQLIDEVGNPVTEPVYGERDFAVMGSFDRGGVIFDITDPDNPEFVNVAPCQQPRNDVGVHTFVDEFGTERVVLALSQQTGTPCPNWEVGGGLTVDINSGPNAGDSYPAVQWGDTAGVNGQTAELVYGGTGCSAAQMAAAAPPGAFIGKIAIITSRVNPYNPADQCPTFTFFQKVNSAEANGAIGVIQVDEDDIPRTGVTAVTATIPGVEINNSSGMPLVEQIVTDGLSVSATLNPGTNILPTFGDANGTGGIGVFDITDPYSPGEMYRIMTTADGVHNFAFHPTAPFGYVSPGELPGGIQDMPIFDFTNLDAPVVKEGLETPQTLGGIHDVELSVDGDFIYAASENNYHIYDNADPGNPVQVGLVAASPQNPPTVPTSGSYAHGLFPDSGQEIMLGQVESIVAGGFLAPGTCPGEGLATYDISGLYVPGASKELPAGPISVYNPPVVGDPAPRFCTSHFGRFVPETRVFALGWYIAGVRIVDFSDPFFPVEIATAVMADDDGTSNTWAAKIYPKKGGYVFAGDIERGFDVFKWNGDGDAPWDTDKNQAPTATDDSGEVDAGMSVNIDVRANDFDANDGRDSLTVSIVSGPASGTADVEADNTVTYTHLGDTATADSFRYRVTDPSGAFDEADVAITINHDGGETECRNALCENDDKPAELTLTYRGGDCSETANSQGSKDDCEDFGDAPPTDDGVYILATNKDDADYDNAKVWFAGDIEPGEAFTLEAAPEDEDDFGSKVFIHIFDSQGGTLLQTVEIHTSCSVPLIDGEQFGALELGDGETDPDAPICSDGEGRVHGSGHWERGTEEKYDKVDFSFDAKHYKGALKGKLKVKDKDLDVKIDAKTITSLSTGTGVDCNGVVLDGINSFAFTAVGTLQFGDGEQEDVEFFACGIDNGKNNDGPFDYFYVEDSFLNYNTGDRVIDNDIDGGNIHLHDPIVDQTPESNSAADGPEATSSESSSATSSSAETSAESEDGVVDLDPILLSSVPAGSPMLLTAVVETADGLLTNGEAVLRWETADGLSGEVASVTNALGVATFAVTVPAGDVDYTVWYGDLSSNGVRVTGF
ncbi:MAG: hypothetical protein HKN07_15965 [Acidimicrobiia bacterium]|nr:hypothetical protein [Acidimicrobiia bacterium]